MITDDGMESIVYGRFIHTKLEALARAEKIKQMCQGEMDEIEDVVGHIDPKEPDVIQNLRRAIRGRHDKLETERAYVYNVRAFMRERGLKCQADFDKITAADIEAHLTDSLRTLFTHETSSWGSKKMWGTKRLPACGNKNTGWKPMPLL
ncbi:hypothetical protein Pla100_11650 [Neorhodopirellula pilleata]|uniref:Integrase SAM-like N-terminal domain-containing protein n=2 Tax=Neorhodopirellula pilleata TaxID=2714738 RepID=A0A5C6APJ2_9BACT|nr:hypothetical protein Pla100_11650 [Neorhodopirellula pilleata]